MNEHKQNNQMSNTASNLREESSPSPLVPKSPSLSDAPQQIAIIGLGYVGLPLARLFATKFPVVGFDINQPRIAALNNGHDATLEVEDDVLQAVLVKQSPFSPSPQVSQSPTSLKTGLYCSNNIDDIK